MYPVSTSHGAGDIVGHRSGTVTDFYKDGLVSAEVNKHYGKPRAAEVEYAPHGMRTGLCAGLAHTAYQDEGLTLQKCGMSTRTVWIIDTTDRPTPPRRGTSRYPPPICHDLHSQRVLRAVGTRTQVTGTPATVPPRPTKSGSRG
ncbi:hypothetical protein ACFZAU_39775 [Streptomyces sp. NPDC008238]